MPVVGGTEAEAKAKAADYMEQLSMEGALAHISGTPSSSPLYTDTAPQKDTGHPGSQP